MYALDRNCLVDQLKAAVQHSVSLHHFPLPMRGEEDAPTDVIYISKQSGQQKWTKLTRKMIISQLLLNHIL